TKSLMRRVNELRRFGTGFEGLQLSRTMETLLKDIKYAARTLRGNPGFSAVAVLTMALGLAANTAIFAALDAVLLRELPVKDPQELVVLSDPDQHGVHGGQESGPRKLFAYHEFEYLRDHNQLFAGMFAADSRGTNMPTSVEGITSEPQTTRISLVSGAYFNVLGVNAVIGRTFDEEVDKERNANPVAVISYNYWKARLACDAAVVGRRIMIGPTPFEIVGVAPQTFVGETVGFAPAVWVPLTMQAAVYRGDDFLSPPKDVKAKYMWLMIVARLRPDVSREQTTAGINVALQQLLQSEASSGMPEDRRRQYLDQR